MRSTTAPACVSPYTMVSMALVFSTTVVGVAAIALIVISAAIAVMVTSFFITISSRIHRLA